MSVVKKVAAMRQLDSMFGNMNLEGRRSPLVSSIVEHDPHCDVHGRHVCSSPYRSSLYLHSSRESSPGYYRESVSPSSGLIIRRRDSLGLAGSPAREMDHPSSFPSILRRPHSPSVTPPRRETPSPIQIYNNKRHSMGLFPNLSRANVVNYNRRDSLSSNGIRDMKRDYVGSTYTLSRKSSIDTKKSSSDSLDNWHIGWDTERHTPVSTDEDRFSFGHLKNQNRNGGHGLPMSANVVAEVNGSRPTFKPVTVLEDLQAVRCAEFHPNGKLYAVGSNTKTLRICAYPKIDDVKDNSAPSAPTVLLKRTKHHKGSIYCLAWSPAGDLLATGFNDKTVKLMRFNSHACNLEGQETWRDLKKKAREEGAKARIARGVTGNHVLVPEVSEISNKILKIIGKESAQGLDVEGESGLGDFIALPVPEPDNFWGRPFADTDDTSAGYALPSPPLPALEPTGPSPCLPPARSPRPARPFVLGAALRPLVPWRPTYRVLHGVPLPLRGFSPRPAPPPPPRLAAATSRPAPRPAPPSPSPSPAPQQPAPPPPPSPPSTSSTRSQQTPAPPRPRARRRPARALEMSTRPTEQYIAGQKQEIRHLQELVAEQRTRNFLLRLKLKRQRPRALNNLRF